MCLIPAIAWSGSALLALVCSPLAQLTATLDPKTYRSPSGEYALFVDPSRPTGGGPGHYRFTRSGQELWAGQRPWTLSGAEVTDDGLVVGYAYGAGVDGGTDDALTIVLLDASGAARLEERTKREGIRSCLGGPEPMVSGLVLDHGNDRLIVRVDGAWGRLDVDSPESWWTYELASGKAGARLAPRKRFPEDQRLGSILAARWLPGTELVLVHWAFLDVENEQLGSVFTLLDEDAEVRWRLDWPADCTIKGDEAAQNRLWQEMLEQGAILDLQVPGRFTLRQAAKGERVTFEVQRVTEGKREGLTVREVARAPYEAEKAGRPAVLPAGPGGAPTTLSPRHLGTILLGEERERGPIHDVMAFDADGRGRLGAICRSDRRFDFLLVDQEGTLLGALELPRAPEGQWWAFETAWVGGDRWVVTGSGSGVDARAAGFWVEPLANSVTAIEGFDCAPVDALAGTGDGGFVALGTLRFRYSMAEVLIAFDARGARRWTLGGDKGDPSGDPEDPASLFAPEGMTVTSDGRVAVVDNIRDLLQFFSKDGEFLRALELEDAWGRDPNYPTGLRRDLGGGLIVHDFNGQPPIVRMGRDDRVTASFQPRFADARTFRLRGDVRCAPDGTLWTSDGQALLLLDPQGVVQRVLGAVPDAAVLGTIARLVVGPGDRLYAADRRTGSVHVFDAGGKRLHVCKPHAQDFDDDLALPSLMVDDAGEVFLADSDSEGFVRFAADGERHGVERFPAGAAWAQPGTGRTWVVGHTGLALLERDRRVARSIVRAPDGVWLRDLGEAAVAPDGSIVLAMSRGETDGRLLHYSAAGEPLRALDLPEGFVSWAPFAFDGERVAFQLREPWTGAASVALLDLATQRLRRLELERTGVRWTPVFAAGGEELWLFDGERRVERYRLD